MVLFGVSTLINEEKFWLARVRKTPKSSLTQFVKPRDSLILNVRFFHMKSFCLILNTRSLTMSIVNADDVPSDGTVPTSQPDHLAITSPDSVQIHREAMPNCSLDPTMLRSFNQNSEIMPVVVIYDSKYGEHSFSGNVDDVHDYTIWSILNTIFCCLLIGIFALYMSHATRMRKRHGYYCRARSASKITALLNITATLCGILIVTLAFLRYFGSIAV